mgnify:CR=1 FL=1
MKKLSIVLLLLISCSAFSAQNWQNGLSVLQQFRTYPYVDKAFELQRQQDFSAAATELEKALKIAPAHPPLLAILFDVHLAIPDISAAIQTYQRLPTPVTNSQLLRIVQTQLDLQQSLALKDYARLLAVLPESERQQIVQVISQHLVAKKQIKQAFDWLLAQTDLSDSLLLQRAELADQLSLPLQVIADTAAVPTTQLTGKDWLRYCMALVSQGQYRQATQLANQHVSADWAVVFYQQLLQIQLSAADWTGAEQSFDWLSTHASLTAAERLQRYHSAINSQNKSLAVQLIPTLQVSCLDKVTMYLQTGVENAAKSTFLQCPRQASAQWLNYADRWLNANELESMSVSNPGLAAQQQQMVLQKRIAEKDYALLLQTKFAQPLHQDDYSLLFEAINNLDNIATRLDYFTKLYRAMPNTELLDQISYLLILQEKPESALDLLERALPFSDTVIQNQVLPERLLNALQQQPAERMVTVLQKLQDWPILVGARAELWRLAGRCQEAERLLVPTPESADGWKTLALCANNVQPAAAIQYWQQVYQLQPEPSYLKQIAYQHQKLQQPQQALTQLQQVPEQHLLPADILTMAELALQAGNSEMAGQYLQQAQPLHAEELARKYAIQAAVFSRQGQAQQSIQSWQQAISLQPAHSDYQLGYAYALAETEPEHALQIMAQLADSGYNFSAIDEAQQAFLNQRLTRLTATAQSTNRALQLYADQNVKSDADLATQFSLVRLQQQLSSHWQVSSSATLSSGAVMAERLVADNAELARHGMALKAEYFVDPLQRDLSLYALLASNGNDSPWKTVGQQFGISYKPSSAVNLWLSAGVQQYPFAEGDWQGLFRVTADLLNTPPWHAEWRPVQHQWWERKVYFDAVWWPESDGRLAQLRFDQGRVWKLNTQSAQVIKWYGLAQYDYRRQDSEQGTSISGDQLATGMGVQWRFWPGQRPVLLARQRFEVNLEWQYQLAGDLNQRQHALLLQLFVAW